jgi:hypothetical protein
MSRNATEAATFIGVGCFGIILLYVVLVLIGAFAVLIGWNMSMPSIFGLKQIDIWEALGLSLLGGAIFAPRTVSTNK